MIGILLTVAVRLFFVRIKLEDNLVSPLIVVYPCLTAFFTFTLGFCSSVNPEGDAMPENDTDAQRQRLGRIVSIAIVAAALITGALVITRTNQLSAHR